MHRRGSFGAAVFHFELDLRVDALLPVVVARELSPPAVGSIDIASRSALCLVCQWDISLRK